jgi:gluconolactonase
LRHIGAPVAPNGIAVDPQGRVIVANMGLLHGQPGTLQRVDVAMGTVETLVSELEGRALVASNCPAVARDGTIYCSHSKWGDVTNIGNTDPSGFVFRVTAEGRADVVARGLRGVNGLCLDAGDRHLYAALTAEGRIVRFRRLADGALGPREDFGAPLGEVVPDHDIADIRKMPTADRARLGYCDGVAFDDAGNLWVTLPFANRLVLLTPGGDRVEVVHDPSGAAIDMPTNLCWGGRDLRDLHVVCRGSGTIVRTRTAVAGLPMANWPAGAAGST